MLEDAGGEGGGIGPDRAEVESDNYVRGDSPEVVDSRETSDGEDSDAEVWPARYGYENRLRVEIVSAVGQTGGTSNRGLEEEGVGV